VPAIVFVAHDVECRRITGRHGSSRISTGQQPRRHSGQARQGPGGHRVELVALDLGLLEGLRRVSLMSSDKTWGVRFSLEKGKLRIESDNPDLGAAKVDVAGEILSGFVDGGRVPPPRG